jgi:BirA family biotin operon repressor/biotin-[acetyl-CoA-carboxylase] ligase
MSDPSTFDGALFESLRENAGLQLGTPLSAHRNATSTNDLALAAARNGAPHGATFVADFQSAGRGRRGRTWLASAGQSLLVSIVLRPSLAADSLGLLPLATGLAVRAALSDLLPATLAEHATVKWPNDVLVGNRKIAGVLTESRHDAVSPSVVVGVGVNVSALNLPAEVRGSATSLALLGVSVSRERLLADVLLCLEMRIAHLSRSPDDVVFELGRHDGLLGRRVRVEDVCGTAAGIDRQGRLRLELVSGEITEIRSGSVEFFD